MAKKSTKKTSDKVKVEITCDNAPGKYLLPYSRGAKAELEAKQAEEMIEAGDAKEV